MARREVPEIWRDGSESTQDMTNMGEWERAAYAYVEEAALSRGKLLKLAGLGLGGVLLGPIAGASARNAVADIVQAGTLIVGRQNNAPLGLDPHKAGGTLDAEVIYQLYDNLVYVEHGKVFPGLATSWSFNPRGTQLTFKLRRGVTFHDGTPFDANAVKYSFDRWLDPKTASPTAGLAGTLLVVTVVDQYTAAFHYKKPYAPVFASLALAWATIESRAAVDKYGDQFGRNPVGTGAYQFVEWTADETIKLRRYPAHKWSTPYYKGPNGKPLTRGPVIDTVEFRVIPNDATRIAALVSKQVDMLYGLGAVPETQVSSLKKVKNLRVQQVPFTGIGNVMILNSTRPPLTDARSRQALSYAIDRKRLVALAINGQGKPATSILGSSFPEYDPKVAKYCQYDPEKARALLKATGQSKGFTIDYVIVDVLASDSVRRAAQLIQQDLAKIKVKMNIKIVPVPVYVDDLINKPLEQRSNAFQNSWSDAEANFLTQLFHSNGGYWTLFKDSQMDAWLDQQAATLNRKKRQSIFSKIQLRIASRAYSLPLYELRLTLASWNYVRNTHLDWLGYIHLQEETRS
jgi:peptide/nickel transport system substrate-binding protein